MSPTPVSNDPGDSGDQNEVKSGDIPAANLMVVAESSSDDEEDLNENVEHEIGYQLLAPGMHFQGPAGPGDSDDDDSSGSDDEESAHENNDAENVAGDALSNDASNSSSQPMSHLQLPPPPANQDLKELRELWKTPRVDSQAIPMAQDQIDTIKGAMASFSLPLSCLPQWANTVPETEWKAQLLLRLGSGRANPKADKLKVKHSDEETVLGSSESNASKTDESAIASENSDTVLKSSGCEDVKP